MKVCIATALYAPYNVGGGELSAQFLAEALVVKGVDVVVLTIGEKNEECFINSVRVVRIKPPNIYWGSMESNKQSSFKKVIWHILESYNFSLGRKLFDFFLKEKPDVLHVRNLIDISPYIWKVGKRHGAKVVTTVNNYASLCIKAGMHKNNSNCKGLCSICKITAIPKRILSGHVDAIVGVSKFTLNRHLENGFFKNAIQRVIYTQTKPNQCELALKMNVYLTFGFIGRLSESKGVIEIIKNFNKLNKSSKLLIAGTGDEGYVKICKEEAKEKIEFLGKVKPEDFYKKIDVLIINSLWHEPFPRVLMESYSYGRPVVSSTYGGTKELIKEGVTGFVYNPENDLLVNVLEKVEAMGINEIQEMSDNCINLHKGFKKTDIDQYNQLYQEVLN